MRKNDFSRARTSESRTCFHEELWQSVAIVLDTAVARASATLLSIFAPVGLRASSLRRVREHTLRPFVETCFFSI